VSKEIVNVARWLTRHCNIAARIRQRLQARRLRRLLADLEREHGPIPADVRAAVDALPWPE
jgi:hypothetical protein